MDPWVKEHPELDLGQSWSALRAEVQTLTVDAAGQDSAAVFSRHTKVVDGIRRLVLYAGETSGLLLDPVAETYFLQDVLTVQVIPWLEATSHLRAVGAAWVGQTPDKDAHGAALACVGEMAHLPCR